MDELIENEKLLCPDENGILDLHEQQWVTLDAIVWSFTDTMLILNVRKNQLVYLPPDIGGFVLMRELLLGHNLLPSLPPQIGNCKQLRKLDLTHNRLSVLPSELQFCERLEEIDVSFNQLISIPKELGKLKELRILNLRHNQLKSIPDSLCECTKLEHVNCDGNALLVDIPESLRENTPLVLWICHKIKQHKEEVDELVHINGDLEKLARMGDDERLRLREEISKLQREKNALEEERPYHYLKVKKTLAHATSQVCIIS
jgi:Leucine-rich repeat (LRR) protein